jgi:hypothetical protein
MTVRMLKNATGSLYEPNSEACHRALEDLRVVLDHLGFKVNKKAAREATLRVYLTKRGRYPLLNPRFEPTAAELDANLDTECLDFTVLSKGDDGSLDRHLLSFPSSDQCTFVRVATASGRYYCHGHFIIPVRFSGATGSEEIDFVNLGAPLGSILSHLRAGP